MPADGSTTPTGHVLSPADHRHLTKVELSRLAGMEPEHLNARLPHIDGWTVHSVIGHLGWICRYVDLSLDADPDAPPSRAAVPEPPAGGEVQAWFDEARLLITDKLDLIDPDSIHPTWTGPRPAAWWLRRLANEASMHRWDAYAAIGSPDPIDPRLAADGIEEVFDVFAPHRLQFDVLDATGASMHLHATDLDTGEWMITFTDTSLEWRQAHEKGDVAARGPVSDLLLMLWGRLPPSRLQLFGDAGLLERWQAAAKF